MLRGIQMIKCSECPRCNNLYLGVLDRNGNHFCICGMTGNKVYTTPRKEKKYNGKGWIKFSESSCGIYDTFEEAFKSMTKPEQMRYNIFHKAKQLSLFDMTGEEHDKQDII